MTCRGDVTGNVTHLTFCLEKRPRSTRIELLIVQRGNTYEIMIVVKDNQIVKGSFQDNDSEPRLHEEKLYD